MFFSERPGSEATHSQCSNAGMLPSFEMFESLAASAR